MKSNKRGAVVIYHFITKEKDFFLKRAHSRVYTSHATMPHIFCSYLSPLILQQHSCMIVLPVVLNSAVPCAMLRLKIQHAPLPDARNYVDLHQVVQTHRSRHHCM